jgi:hypothetical protein
VLSLSKSVDTETHNLTDLAHRDFTEEQRNVWRKVRLVGDNPGPGAVLLRDDFPICFTLGPLDCFYVNIEVCVC